MTAAEQAEARWGPAATTARGKRLLAGCLLAAAIAVAVLAVNAALYNPGQLHLKFTYVDQAGYILAARTLAATGELRNGVVFPSRIDDPGFYVHMPGHTVALAASYALFGWGVVQTLLPSLVAFVAGAVGVFAIGNRLYGRSAGLLAAALFALFPANVTYAFTAMAELTFTCACVAATVVFVYLPRRALAFGPPLLLIPPFLFRETGAFLILPMALCVLHVRGVAPAALTSAGSVVTLWLVNRWQIASGKIAASLAWVTEGGFNYGDAFAEAPPRLSAGGWLAALGENAADNLAHLREHASAFPGELMPWALYGVLLVASLALVLGIRGRRDDPFALGAGVLMAFVALLAVLVYDAKAHKLLRTLMYTFPFGVAALGGAATRLLRPATLGVLLALVALAGFQVSRLAARAMTLQDELTPLNTRELAKLHGSGTIVAGNLAATLAVTEYPAVTWCLPAENEETLALVLQRYDVGTIVVFEPLSEEFVRSHGLRLTHRQRVGARWHTFYQPVRSRDDDRAPPEAR